MADQRGAHRLERKVMRDGLEKVTAESVGTGALLTPDDYRFQGLVMMGKGLGLILLGGVLVAGMLAMGMEGGAGLPALVLLPTLYFGAARVASGLTALLLGRPWERTHFLVKLPAMILVGALALFLTILVGTLVR